MKNGYYRDEQHPWLKTQNFCDLQVSELKALVDSKFVAGGAPSALIFDLDSTLFCTAARNSRVFWRFLRQKNRVPSLWFRLWQNIGPANQQYSIVMTFGEELRRLGLRQPELERELRALWSEYKDFWAEEFFLSQNIAHDTPYPGAVELLHDFYRKGFEIIYLTGRDAPRCQAGTVDALKRAQFPMGPRVHLRLKNRSDQADLDFKLEAIRRIKAEFDVVLSIDNEPENLVMFAQELPESEIVFFHSIMSSREPASSYQDVLGHRRAWKMISF